MTTPGITSEPSIQERRLSLDKRISELQAEIQKLQHERNLLSPAAILPHEILCRIFSICRDDGLKTDSNDFDGCYKTHDLRWRAVSYVCSSWRTAACGHRSLWRYIQYQPYQYPLADLMAMRAAPVPLHVSAHIEDGRFPFNRVSRQVLEHTEHLELHYVPLHILLVTPLSSPLPLLRSIWITGCMPLRTNHGRWSYVSKLLNQLLGGYASLLERATFDFVHLSFNDITFMRSLRELSIRNGTLTGNSKQMLAVLGQMRNLRSFRLTQNKIRTESNGLIDETRQNDGTFPRLHLLEFHGGYEWVNNLLGRLNIDSLHYCKIQVHASSMNSPSLYLDFIHRYYSQKFTNRGTVVHTLNFDEEFIGINAAHNDNPILEFSVQMRMEPSQNTNPVTFFWISQSVALFDLSHVTRLIIGSTTDQTLSTLWRSLAPRLTSLAIVSFNTSEVDDAKGRIVTSIIDSIIHDNCHLPTLTTVEINHFTWPSLIENWLQLRCQTGHKLPTLTILEPSKWADLSPVENMRQWVGHVVGYSNDQECSA